MDEVRKIYFPNKHIITDLYKLREVTVRVFDEFRSVINWEVIEKYWLGIDVDTHKDYNVM